MRKMSKTVKCICGEEFPIRGVNNIGEHALECPPILEKKAKKKAKQSVDKAKELQLFTDPKNGIPPCMCQAKYEETRLAFSIKAQIEKPMETKLVFIDFPNFPTGEEWEQRKFWNFLFKLSNETTQFRIYLKFINKRWLLKTLKTVTIIQEFLDRITFYIVESDKAPVSRDDILMLKHISMETGNVVIPVRYSGEKYRDLGYHPDGNHIDECRAVERFGGKKPFKWTTYKIVIGHDKLKYVKIANHNCSTKEVVVTGFKPNISFVKY